MIYIANHQIRHNGKLYQKGDEIEGLKHTEAQELLKHRAITKYGKEPEEKAPEAAKEVKADKPKPAGAGKK